MISFAVGLPIGQSLDDALILLPIALTAEARARYASGTEVRHETLDR